MHHVTHHVSARPIQRQNARRHIIRITANYRRHYLLTGSAVRARIEVIRAFQMHMLSSRRAILARAEA
jgi:hypothetical protein